MEIKRGRSILKLFVLVIVISLSNIASAGPGGGKGKGGPHKKKTVAASVELVTSAALEGGSNGIAADGCTQVGGLVNTVGVHVHESVTMRIVGIEAQSEAFNISVRSSDESIAIPGSNNIASSRITQIKVPANSSESEPFKVLGQSKVGSARFSGSGVLPDSLATITIGFDIGSWRFRGFEDAVDIHDLGGGNLCYQSGDPDIPVPIASRKTCGSFVRGVSADGQSRLMMRLQAGRAGRTCFKVISDGPPDTGVTNPVDLIPTEADGGLHWGFSNYTAPKEFDDDSLDNREVEIEVAYTPADSSGGYSSTATTTTTHKIRIHRPPVLLLHGVWSDASTWGAGFSRPRPNFGWRSKAENYPNAESLQENKDIVGGFIKERVEFARKTLRRATTQTDIIAHSMGGLLSRRWIADSNYLRDENFKQGDIRKLVTLHTPHSGSPLANLIINIVDELGINHRGVQSFQNNLGPFTRGAVCDLAEGGLGINQPATRKAKVFAYAGNGGDPTGFSGPWLPTLAAWKFLPSDRSQHINPYLFGGAENDGIVTVDSQNGGLINAALSNEVHSDWLGGAHVTASQSTATAVFSGLNFANGFQDEFPMVDSNLDGVPTTPNVGRTDVANADSANFTAQCLPGGPMVQNVDLAIESVDVKLTNHPGIQIVSPLPGATYEPGSVVPFEVIVDPAFNATQVLVLPSISSALEGPLVMNGPSFVGSMTLKDDFSGALEFEVTAMDDTGGEVGSSYVVTEAISSEVPTSMFTLNDVVFMSPGVGGRQINPVAIYADEIHRHVYTQSNFSSSNPAVATVTPSGLVTAVSKGVAFITAEFKGQKAYAEIRVRDPALSEDSPVENTPSVSITKSGIRVNRVTGRFVQQVTITNTSSLPLSQPLWLSINDLPSGVALVNQEGVTKNLGVLGSPLVSLEVRNVNQQSFLVPGSSTTATLEFTNVNSISIDYTTRVFSAFKP